MAMSDAPTGPIVSWLDYYPGQTVEKREAAEQAVREAIRAQRTAGFVEEIGLLWKVVHALAELAGFNVAAIEQEYE